MQVGLAATRMMNKGRVQTEEDDLANEMVSSKRKTVDVVSSEQTKPQQTYVSSLRLFICMFKECRCFDFGRICLG